MASPSVDPDIEAQSNSVMDTQPAIIANPPPTTNTANPQLPTSADPQPQATNTNQHHNGNPPAPQTANKSQVRRDENHGDSSDGLWSMYLTQAEKQDTQVTGSWKGDTDGILVFTGLFSVTVATFIIESYKKLSPDSSDTTNALLTQISVQLFNISNGTPLATVAAQSDQPFKPTASAVRVNVLWFLSLVLSLTCALSVTLMQQWARRYQELAQRRGAFHRRGRMRAYLFDGINRFGMARAVATMPTLLHISVFLFFVGLVEFLFPIYTTVAYATLGCIGVFALAYAILTVLPNICLNCPYGTPLSGFTWRISQVSVIGYLWTILKIEGLFRKSLSKLWSLANQHAPEPHGLKRWRETIETQVKMRRRWFSQDMRKSIELSAYTRANSTVVTSALVWTLAALDEDKEIEDFAARVPGFFDSRVVPDATLAVLPLMSHEPTTDPIFGSRLYDLLKTCIPETSILDEKTRNNRLRVCMRCLWYFGKAYTQLGSSQVLPSYIPDALAGPEITRHIQAEEDSGVRVIGRCFGALIINKLAADINSRTVPVNNAELACLSSILASESRDVRLCLTQPGIIELVNMAPFALGHVGSFKVDDVPLDSRDVLRKTLGILSQALPAQENAEIQPDQTVALSNISDDRFERTIVSRFHGFLKICIPGASPLTEEVRTSCLRMCLKTLWHSGKAYHYTSDPLPPYFPLILAGPEITHHFHTEQDPVARLTGCCFGALIVSKLVDTLKSPISLSGHVDNAELACISAILGTGYREDLLLPHQLRIISFLNLVSLVSGEIDILFTTEGMPADMLDIAQDTLHVLANRLCDSRFGFEDVPMDQRGLLLDIHVEVQNTVRSDPDRLKDQTVKTLDRLRQALEKILPAVE